MGWEGGYDILGSAGGSSPLAFLSWNAPSTADVLAAGGASGYATGQPLSDISGSSYANLSALPAAGTGYPALGFDPAPGDPGELAQLVAALGTAAHKLGSAQALIQKMADDKDSWQGSAAEAFHGQLKQDLPKYLDEGSKSLQQAADTLKGWGTRLDGYRAKAAGYEADAASSRSTFGSAWTDAVSAVADNRDALALQGQHFDNSASLQAADARLKSAVSTINDAVTRLDGAFSGLQQVLGDAKGLADSHSEDASGVARALKSNASNLAPHKPNPFLNWLKEHGGDILSALAAVCGVIALFCPVFAVAAILLSLVALGLHAWKFAADGELFPIGKNGGNWLTLGCDLLGALPGIGVTAKAAGWLKDGAEAAEATEGVAGATEAASAADESASAGTEAAADAGADGAAESGDAAAKAPNFAQRWAAAAGSRAGGDAGVNPYLQSGVNRALGVTRDSDAAIQGAATMGGKMVQFTINSTGAVFSGASLLPSTGNSDGFDNTNTDVTVGGGVSGASSITADFMDIAKSWK